MKIADISRGVILGGRFKLWDFLGDGSFGYVWKAEVIDYEAIKLPPVVAIKYLSSLKVVTSSSFVKRKRLRSSTIFGWSRSSMPNESTGCPHVDGVCPRRKFTPSDWRLAVADARVPQHGLDWLKGIAEGLAHMHMQQPPVGHGDLKLDNVLVDPTKGCDWSTLARASNCRRSLSTPMVTEHSRTWLLN